MSLKPLGHRVLIRPDEQPEQSDSGLILPQDRDHVSYSGTVVAVGNGPARDARVREATIKMCVSIVEKVIPDGSSHLRGPVIRTIGALAGKTVTEPNLHVGDRVAFSAESGLTFTEDGVEYLVMNEDDVVVLVKDEESAA